MFLIIIIVFDYYITIIILYIHINIEYVCVYKYIIYVYIYICLVIYLFMYVCIYLYIYLYWYLYCYLFIYSSISFSVFMGFLMIEWMLMGYMIVPQLPFVVSRRYATSPFWKGKSSLSPSINGPFPSKKREGPPMIFTAIKPPEKHGEFSDIDMSDSPNMGAFDLGSFGEKNHGWTSTRMTGFCEMKWNV